MFYEKRWARSLCGLRILDATKAFDKVSHHGLFYKMLWKGVPVIFVQLLTYWYTHLYKLAMWSIDLIINHYFIFVISIGGNRSDNRYKIISKFFSNIYITRAAICSTIAGLRLVEQNRLGSLRASAPGASHYLLLTYLCQYAWIIDLCQYAWIIFS